MEDFENANNEKSALKVILRKLFGTFVQALVMTWFFLWLLVFFAYLWCFL